MPWSAYSEASHADSLRQQSGGPLFLAFVRRASALGADEELLAVLEGDIAAVGAVGAVFRLIAFDDDLGAREQRILRPTAAEECVRRAGFDHPVGDRAVSVLH